MNFKFSSTLAACILALTAGFQAAPALAGAADFTLVNRTGYDIGEVYVSPANKDSWGRDRLGKNVLENGKAKMFTFSDAANCVQDIRVVFDDDNSTVTWEDIDLCEVHKITLRYDRRSRKVSAEAE